MLTAGKQILAFIAIIAVVVAVVNACSQTAIFPLFHYPGGAVLIYGLSMTLVWFMRHVVPFRFPAGYYRLRPFEMDGRLNRRLCGTFKWLLFKSRVELLNFSARLSPGKAGLLRFAQGIREAETDHAIAFLVMIVITIHAVMNAWLALAGWLLLANAVANVYPIMLQRSNRARLLPVRERLGTRNDR